MVLKKIYNSIKTFKENIEGQDIETHSKFVVTFDSNKLNLSIVNDSITSNKRKEIARDDLDNEETPKDSESSIEKKNMQRNILWNQCLKKT